jgi:succinate-semialdehyde dehydrogenase/glutarate-semialdehyde dehydrogenase
MEEWLARCVDKASRQQPAVAALTLDERLGRAHRSRARLGEAGAQIVESAVREAQMPRKFAEREVRSALQLLDALPEFAEALRPRALPAASGTTVLEWRPYGVVLGLHSANSPIWVPTVVSMSALVAGNAVVCRPSSRVRRTTQLVLDALATAWPSGALAIADCNRAGAQALLVAPGIDAVVAHASTEICKQHLATLADAYASDVVLRPYIPEASGNDVLMVLPGADIAAAAGAIAVGAFANAGQLCFSAKRILVHRSVWQHLRGALQDAVAAIVIGDPSDPDTDLARRTTGDQSAAELAFRAALAAGGELVVGRVPEPGETEPRLVLLPRERLAELDLWRREIFAPVRGIVLIEDTDDAIGLAADTRFGIGASVFGGNPADHRRIGDALRVARLLINESPLYQDPQLVVGGVRDSGYGGSRPKLEQLVYARRVHTA